MLYRSCPNGSQSSVPRACLVNGTVTITFYFSFTDDESFGEKVPYTTTPTIADIKIMQSHESVCKYLRHSPDFSEDFREMAIDRS